LKGAIDSYFSFTAETAEHAEGIFFLLSPDPPKIPADRKAGKQKSAILRNFSGCKKKIRYIL
jgi:hypothetical protein